MPVRAHQRRAGVRAEPEPNQIVVRVALAVVAGGGNAGALVRRSMRAQRCRTTRARSSVDEPPFVFQNTTRVARRKSDIVAFKSTSLRAHLEDEFFQRLGPLALLVEAARQLPQLLGDGVVRGHVLVPGAADAADGVRGDEADAAFDVSSAAFGRGRLFFFDASFQVFAFVFESPRLFEQRVQSSFRLGETRGLVSRGDVSRGPPRRRRRDGGRKRARG